MKTTKLASVSTAVALLAALAGPAVAASPDPGQSVGQNSTVSGTTSGTNQSTIDGSSMSGVNGNAAMNSSTGDGTQQANELYLQRSSGSTQTSSQTSKQSVGVSFLTQSGLTNTSTIGGSAGSGNQGNTAFNSAAGDGHEQANLLNLSALNGSGATSNATQTLNQTFSQQQVVSNGATNTSTIGNQGGSNPSAPGPGEKANGIVTFNSASGAENVQANGTTLIRSNAGISGSATQAITQQGATGGGYVSQGGVNNAHIDRAASFVTGIAAINNSTGAQNAQANGVVLYDPANGTGSGSSSATQNVTQQYGSGSTRGNTVVISGTQSSDIGTAGNAHGSPMYGGQGLGAINNTSGASNQQANAVFLNNAALGSSGMQNQSSSSGQSFTGSGSSNSDLTTTANSTSNIQGNTGATSTGAILLNSGAGAANSQYNEMYLNNGSSGGGSSTTNQTLNQSISTASASVDGSTNTGNISDQVGQNVNGYVAANSAGGAGNQQGNQLIVLMNSSASKQVTPTVGVSQTDTATVNGSSTNNATLNGAFQNVKGAASANVAGGAFNQQGNTILVTDGTLSGVSPTVSQQTNVSVSSSPGSTNTGAIGGGAFAGSSGAVSANVAAGAGNVQSNVIVLGNH